MVKYISPGCGKGSNSVTRARRCPSAGKIWYTIAKYSANFGRIPSGGSPALCPELAGVRKFD